MSKENKEGFYKRVNLISNKHEKLFRYNNRETQVKELVINL